MFFFTESASRGALWIDGQTEGKILDGQQLGVNHFAHLSQGTVRKGVHLVQGNVRKKKLLHPKMDGWKMIFEFVSG